MIRRDYKPGRGPIRGLVHALPITTVLWAVIAALVWAAW